MKHEHFLVFKLAQKTFGARILSNVYQIQEPLKMKNYTLQTALKSLLIMNLHKKFVTISSS